MKTKIYFHFKKVKRTSNLHNDNSNQFSSDVFFEKKIIGIPKYFETICLSLPARKKVGKSNFNFDQKKNWAEVFLLIGFLSADVTTSIIDK